MYYGREHLSNIPSQISANPPANASLARKKAPTGAGAVADKVKGLFDNTLQSVETALSRSPLQAIRQESKAVIGHPVSIL